MKIAHTLLWLLFFAVPIAGEAGQPERSEGGGSGGGTPSFKTGLDRDSNETLEGSGIHRVAGQPERSEGGGSGIPRVAGQLARLPGVASLSAGSMAEAVSGECSLTAAEAPASLVTRPGERVVRTVEVRVSPVGRGPFAGTARLAFDNLDARDATRRLAVVRTGEIPGPDGKSLGQGWSYLAGSTPGDGGTLAVEVPLLPGHPQLYTVVDWTHSSELEQEPELIETPEDPLPLGDRRPLILVHGQESQEKPTDGVNNGGKLATWNKLRANPRFRSLLASCKCYVYLYPTYRTVEQNGRDLVRLVDQKIGLARIGPSRAFLVGISMGGLVSRHAMRTGGFGEKVKTLVTLATPHHGSPTCSLILSRWDLHKKLGWFWTLVAKGAQWQHYPDNPGLRCLLWDDYDGGISDGDQRDLGIPVSREVAEFNRSEPYAGKIFCLMGDIRSLMGHGPLGFFELARRGTASYSARYSDVDPHVSKSSGTFAGAAVRGSKTYPGVDHIQIGDDPNVLNDLFDILTADASDERI